MLFATGLSIFFILFGLTNIIYKPYYHSDETVDLRKVAIIQGILSLSLGISFFPVYAVFKFYGLNKILPFFLFFFLLVFAYIMNQVPKWYKVKDTAKAKFGRDGYLKRTRPSKKYAIILAIVAPSLTLLLALKMPEKTFENNHLKISGMYGVAKNIDEIVIIDTVGTLPETSEIVDGVKMFHTLKGSFKNKNDEVIRVFANDFFSPFIYIEYKRANKLYFNFKDPDETRSMFRELRVAKQQGAMP